MTPEKELLLITALLVGFIFLVFGDKHADRNCKRKGREKRPKH